MKPCFGYVRVSTVKQGEGVSLEAQRDAILAFALKNRIEITQWFEEKETAAKAGRPVFGAMLKLLKHKMAAGVVLHRPDRAARNFADWAKIGDLSDTGIDVFFASESLDFRSRGGRLSADIQAVIAADYIRNLKEEIHKGQSGQLKRGLYPFSAPLGYQNNGGGKHKTIDPIKGPMVRRVFELYASGEHSMRTLLIEMDRMGLRTHAGTRVPKASLEAMFGNPFYTGVIHIKRTGQVHGGTHEPLIPASLFERVQQLRLGKCGKKVTKHTHTFRGLFTCAHCGTAMIPEAQKGHVYYRCHTPACVTKTIREEQLEDAIISVLSHTTFSNEQLDHITDTLTLGIKNHNASSPSSSHRLQLEQLNKRLEKLTDALIEKLIESDVFNTRKERLLLDKAALEEKIADDPIRRATPWHIRQFLELVKNLCSSYKIALPTEKRQIVQMATSNRTVSGKNILIERKRPVTPALFGVGG
jgi:site-specific DNA recombinase